MPLYPKQIFESLKYTLLHTVWWIIRQSSFNGFIFIERLMALLAFTHLPRFVGSFFRLAQTRNHMAKLAGSFSSFKRHGASLLSNYMKLNLSGKFVTFPKRNKTSTTRNSLKRHDNVEILLWQFNQQGFLSSTFSLARFVTSPSVFDDMETKYTFYHVVVQKTCSLVSVLGWKTHLAGRAQGWSFTLMLT